MSGGASLENILLDMCQNICKCTSFKQALDKAKKYDSEKIIGSNSNSLIYKLSVLYLALGGKPGEIAAAIHRYMCSHPGYKTAGHFYYSQGGYSSLDGPNESRTGGVGVFTFSEGEATNISIDAGGYDCSSSVSTAWKLALSAAGEPSFFTGSETTSDIISKCGGSTRWKSVSEGTASLGTLAVTHSTDKQHVVMKNEGGWSSFTGHLGGTNSAGILQPSDASGSGYAHYFEYVG